MSRRELISDAGLRQLCGDDSRAAEEVATDEDDGDGVLAALLLVGDSFGNSDDKWSVESLLMAPLRRLMLGGTTISGDGPRAIKSCVSSVEMRWEILYGRLSVSVVPPKGPLVLLPPPLLLLV